MERKEVLDRLQSDLETLDLRMALLEKDLREESVRIQRDFGQLVERRRHVSDAMSRLQLASAARWDDAQAGAEAAVHELREVIHTIRTRAPAM